MSLIQLLSCSAKLTLRPMYVLRTLTSPHGLHLLPMIFSSREALDNILTSSDSAVILLSAAHQSRQKILSIAADTCILLHFDLLANRTQESFQMMNCISSKTPFPLGTYILSSAVSFERYRVDENKRWMKDASNLLYACCA